VELLEVFGRPMTMPVWAYFLVWAVAFGVGCLLSSDLRHVKPVRGRHAKKRGEPDER
jgi:hypothetical protein